MSSDVFFTGWQTILRTFLIGLIAYAGLVFFIRISGKRSLAKLNSFDLVVTVALGSTLSSAILDKTVSAAQVLAAFAVLLLLQFLVTWTSTRSKAFRHLVSADPVLLVLKGEVLNKTMKASRMTHADLEASLRKSGVSTVEEADAVILETDGTLSVIRSANPESDSAMQTVDIPEKQQT